MTLSFQTHHPWEDIFICFPGVLYKGLTYKVIPYGLPSSFWVRGKACLGKSVMCNTPHFTYSLEFSVVFNSEEGSGLYFSNMSVPHQDTACLSLGSDH